MPRSQSPGGLGPDHWTDRTHIPPHLRGPLPSTLFLAQAIAQTNPRPLYLHRVGGGKKGRESTERAINHIERLKCGILWFF